MTFPLELVLTDAAERDRELRLRWAPFRRVTASDVCARLGLPRFVDPDRPPGPWWLEGAGRDRTPKQPSTWARLTDLPGGQAPVVFDGVEASDIRQGALGDCWLLSSLACLAEFPSLVRCLLVDEGTDPLAGRFTVRLFEPYTDGAARRAGAPGVWHEVVVDDWVPVFEWSGRPCFAKAFGNEMWVSLLEKAAAKLAGGYHMIGCGGETKVALETLTGDVTWSYARVDGRWRGFRGAKKGLPTMDARPPYWPEEGEVRDLGPEEFWGTLREADERGWVVAAGTAAVAAGAETRGADGLVYGHAYTVIECREVAAATLGPRSPARLMRVRNPWGTFDWNGAWSDRSGAWDAHPDVRAAVDPALAEDDGEFWIDFDDFAAHFRTVAVCEVGARPETSSSVLFARQAVAALKHERLAELASRRRAGLLRRAVRLLSKGRKLVGPAHRTRYSVDDLAAGPVGDAVRAAADRARGRVRARGRAGAGAVAGAEGGGGGEGGEGKGKGEAIAHGDDGVSAPPPRRGRWGAMASWVLLGVACAALGWAAWGLLKHAT